MSHRWAANVGARKGLCAVDESAWTPNPIHVATYPQAVTVTMNTSSIANF
jgi:hypothetical protein